MEWEGSLLTAVMVVALVGNRNLNTNGMLGELSLWDSVRFWSINTQNRRKTTGSKAFGGILGGRGVRHNAGFMDPSGVGWLCQVTTTVLGRVHFFYRGRVQRSRCEHIDRLSFGMQCGLEGLMSFEVQKNQLMEKVNTQLLIFAPFGSV